MSGASTFVTKQGANLEWKTKKLAKDFCESTSLHGYSYLYIANSVLGKIFWVATILITTGLAITFLVRNTKAFLDARLVTNIESTYENLSVRNTVQTNSNFTPLVIHFNRNSQKVKQHFSRSP